MFPAPNKVKEMVDCFIADLKDGKDVSQYSQLQFERYVAPKKAKPDFKQLAEEQVKNKTRSINEE